MCRKWILICVLSTLASVLLAVENLEDGGKAFEDPRVSSLQIQSAPINSREQWQWPSARQQADSGQVADQFGKQVNPLRPTTSQPLERRKLAQQQQPQVERQKPGPRSRVDRGPMRAALVGRNPEARNVSSVKVQQRQRENCNWLRLNEFENVLLDTNAVIVRDKDEHPCYLLTIKGYFTIAGVYFYPLNNLKEIPNSNMIISRLSPQEGATFNGQNSLPINAEGKQEWLNCNHPQQQAGYFNQARVPFKEEITILFNCGFLVLTTTSPDGVHLLLESISFYYYDINATPLRSSKFKLAQSNSQTNIVLDASSSSQNSDQLDRLIFSTKNSTLRHPLIKMLIGSRYICENRIVLKSSGLTQLVLDKFELQRLSQLTWPRRPQNFGAQQDVGVSSELKPNLVEPIGIKLRAKRGVIVHVMGESLLCKNGSAIERCPAVITDSSTVFQKAEVVPDREFAREEPLQHKFSSAESLNINGYKVTLFIQLMMSILISVIFNVLRRDKPDLV